MSDHPLQAHPVLSAPVAARWPRDVLVVRGPDAVTYLQGQVSADVVTLEPGQSTVALLLEPGGKLEAVTRLWRTDESVLVIDTDRGAGDAVEARLRRFLLRTDAEIARLDWDCIAVRGPGSVDLGTDDSGAELVGLGLWPGIEGIDLLGPSPRLPEAATEVSAEQLEALRVRSGWPAHGAEVAEGVIPAEIGPWLITAGVSFTKGCYVGQELTARIDSRGGNVPRNLRSLELDRPDGVQPGAPIVVRGAEGEQVGAVTSAAVDPATGTTVALGFVKRAVAEDAQLEVGD